MRRLVWFAGGVAAGAAGVEYTKRKVAAAADRMRPTNLAHSATGALRRGGQRVVGAVHEGVSAARRRENELKAERDGRLVRLRDHLTEGDEVLVDGEVVEPGRVLLMRRPERSNER
jgi:hypothetical protein